MNEDNVSAEIKKKDSTIINCEISRLLHISLRLPSPSFSFFMFLFSDLFSRSLKSKQNSLYFIIILRSINWCGFTSTTFKTKIESCDKQFLDVGVESFFIKWKSFSIKYWESSLVKGWMTNCVGNDVPEVYQLLGNVEWLKNLISQSFSFDEHPR